MSLGRRTVKCFRPGGSYVDGRWEESTAPAAFTIEASVQPLRGKELESLPEGRRASASFKLYTDFKLRTVDDKAQKNPDRVNIDALIYEVINVLPFQSGIISHYKAIVALDENPPDGAF